MLQVGLPDQVGWVILNQPNLDGMCLLRDSELQTAVIVADDEVLLWYLPKKDIQAALASRGRNSCGMGSNLDLVVFCMRR